MSPLTRSQTIMDQGALARKEILRTSACRADGWLRCSSAQQRYGSSILRSGSAGAIGGTLGGRPRQSRIFWMASGAWIAERILMGPWGTLGTPGHPQRRPGARAAKSEESDSHAIIEMILVQNRFEELKRLVPGGKK